MWHLMVHMSRRRRPVRREHAVTASKNSGRSYHSDRDAARQTAFVAVLALGWGATLATQYVAAQLGSRHRLGVWLYRVPPASRLWIGLAMAVTAVAATIALTRCGWRWACIPLMLVAASLYAALGDVIYPPTEVWRWTSRSVGCPRIVRRFGWRGSLSLPPW